MSEKTIIVIPCYNEVHRLREAFLSALLVRPEVKILLVDDGSTDGTAAWLQTWAGRYPEQAAVLAIPKNAGKGEAVRRGVVEALRSDPAYFGYLDADGAVPPEECLRLLDVIREAPASLAVVMGSRVKMLGHSIHRNEFRHYTGRVFATLASRILELPVYDTQCGVNLFRNQAVTRAAFQEPFVSRWFFDVEILGRLAVPPAAIREVPLLSWRDAEGSKRASFDYARAIVDLGRVARSLSRIRTARRAV